MEFLTCELTINFKHSFKSSSDQFNKLIMEAVKVTPCLVAFDLDFDYAGIEGEAHGIQIDPDTLSSGNYSIKANKDNSFELIVDCVSNVDLIFRSEAHLLSFEKAKKNGSLKISVASICNNGSSKKTFWSMECTPHISLNANEVIFS